MPMRRRTAVGETPGAYSDAPRYSTSPSTRAPSTRSFIRFSVRSTVVLPHPDGPMNAVMSFSWMVRDIRYGPERPVVARDVPRVEDRRTRRIGGCGARLPQRRRLGQRGRDGNLLWIFHVVPSGNGPVDIPSARIGRIAR